MNVYNCDDRSFDGISVCDPDYCGTSACAVGHVPYTGISGWETQSSWNAVAQNLLGAPTYSPGYRFLFDQDNVDCPWAAALRIRHFLAHNSVDRSEEHTSELQSLMRISYAVFCLKKK